MPAHQLHVLGLLKNHLDVMSAIEVENYVKMPNAQINRRRL